VKGFVVAPKLRKKSATTSQVEVATNLINCNGSAVAAATGRGFKSRRTDFMFLPMAMKALSNSIAGGKQGRGCPHGTLKIRLAARSSAQRVLHTPTT
jgi:hypothetical protein